MSVLHVFWTVVFLLALAVIVVSIPIQRRALNRIAFGRSMFITWTAILFGFMISLLPGLPATIVALALFVLGFGMMILITLKSYQHLQKQGLRRR